MRADRLLAELMLIQARGQVTAAALATELEVSERTVYRDMEALQMAGVPLVAMAGPGGGYSLFRDWTSDLTGLTADETTALSVALVAGPAAGGGAERSVRAAVRKIAAALPEASRRGLQRLHDRVHVDDDPAAGSELPVSVIAAALQAGAAVALTVPGPFGTAVQRRGTPLGLVLSGGRWHVVWAPAGSLPRADLLDSVLAAAPAGPGAVLPAGFDLAAFWDSYRERSARRSGNVRAVVRVSPDLVLLLRRTLGDRVATGDDGVAVVAFDSIDEARDTVLGWGGAAEVLEPEALRRTVADFARQAAARYEA